MKTKKATSEKKTAMKILYWGYKWVLSCDLKLLMLVALLMVWSSLFHRAELSIQWQLRKICLQHAFLMVELSSWHTMMSELASSQARILHWGTHSCIEDSLWRDLKTGDCFWKKFSFERNHSEALTDVLRAESVKWSKQTRAFWKKLVLKEIIVWSVYKSPSFPYQYILFVWRVINLMCKVCE